MSKTIHHVSSKLELKLFSLGKQVWILAHTLTSKSVVVGDRRYKIIKGIIGCYSFYNL